MPPPPIPRAWLVVVALLLVACLFAGLGSIGFVGPDEPRYASVARAMARSGDWLTPRLDGRPWFEKPALYYWSAAADFELFGANERAARLPAALAALAGALLLGWAAKRFYGANAAILALVLFPTSVGLFAFAHAASMDMLLAAALEAAMVLGLDVLFAPGVGNAPSGRRGLRLALVGAAIGVATLAKGPVAIVLAGGSVLLWAGVTRRWRDACLFLRPESVAAFALVALPWYIACSAANPGFARTFLWLHNVERFLTPVFEHRQPWWFFAPVIALGLAPWTAVLLLTARDGARVFRLGEAARSPGVFLACWAAFPLLFFSLSQSKLPGYILPALPPLVLLIARSLESGAGDRFGRAAVALVGATWIALAASAAHWLRRLPPDWDTVHRQGIRGWLVATIVLGLAVAILAVAKRARWAVLCSALWMGILVATVSWAYLPQLDPYLSARDAALAIESQTGKNARVEIYRLPRDWQYGLNYYFDRELPEWPAAGEGPVWVVTTGRNLTHFASGSKNVLRIAPLGGGLFLVQCGPASRE